MIVFSFWPDVVMLKEIGDPLSVARHLQLDRKELHARVIMAQGRQNTNYAINLYACHPFFIQGFASMTNGENTAFVPIRTFLESRGFPGYIGYNSDSEVFTHILHYTTRSLGFGIEAYKHVITPLQDGDIDRHPNAALPAQPQAVLPAAHHRRPQLRHRLPARRQPLHGAGPQETAARASSAASPGCTPSPRRSAAWTPPSRCATRARTFSPWCWTPRSSPPTARRFGYAARKTH